MHSFPSGHVGTATALWGLIIILVWTYAWSARRWVAPLLLVPPLVVLSRMYEGAHHLSDVLTSLAFASGWLTIVAMLLLPFLDSRQLTRHARLLERYRRARRAER